MATSESGCRAAKPYPSAQAHALGARVPIEMTMIVLGQLHSTCSCSARANLPCPNLWKVGTSCHVRHVTAFGMHALPLDSLGCAGSDWCMFGAGVWNRS